MIRLQRHNWSTGQRELKPVNEEVLQEIVDILFHRGERWLKDPEWFQRQLRNWQGRLDIVPPEPEPALVPAGGVSEGLDDLVRGLQAEGKSPSVIQAEVRVKVRELLALSG